MEIIKDNQLNLKRDIEDYFQDDQLRSTVDYCEATETNRDRIEKRTAYSTTDAAWLSGRDEWKNLACIGAIHTQFSSSTGNSDEWHYYISSRKLTAEALLKHARAEWSVETMHWLLDVHFGEDGCKARNDNLQYA